MSYRVQFTISDEEYDKLVEEADDAGFPNIQEMCKRRALNGENSYAKLYMDMVAEINNIPVGKEFYLRDIIKTPPTLLGRWLFENVKNGKIKDVEHLGNDKTNPERYRKVKFLFEHSDNNEYRYILGEIKNESKKPLLILGLNPSTAVPNNLDPTVQRVKDIAKYNGSENWIMLNVYPKRMTDPDELYEKVNEDEHQKNLENIINVISQYNNISILVAYGNIINKRDYLKTCLIDIYDKLIELGIEINWLCIKTNEDGTPKHPLYSKKESKLSVYEMEEYIKSIR